MKRFSALFLILLLVFGSCALAEDAPRKADFPDNTFEDMSPDFISGVKNRGKIVSFRYDATASTGESYSKSALVYLPYGYDENDQDTRYNVLYLMHGGGDGFTFYFNAPNAVTNLSLTLDAMFEKGRCEPFIVVTPTFNDPTGGPSTGGAANFWYEFKHYLIPAFESQYNTYAEDVTPEGIRASRTHRAYGGFSMGGLSTWAVFANCLDEVAYFMPFSGDYWVASTADAKAATLAQRVAASGYTKDDFFIYAGCGGEGDVAYRGMTDMIAAMQNYPEAFVFCENFKDGNLYYTQCDGGHSVKTVQKIMYSGMPTFFDP